MGRPSEAVEQHLKQLRFICVAILSGVTFFSGVVWYLVNVGNFTPSGSRPAYLATTLNVAALGVLVVALLLPGLLWAPSREEGVEGRLARHRRHTILGFALREGAAFLALVGVLLTGEQFGGFAIATLALLSMVLAWPRAEQLDDS